MNKYRIKYRSDKFAHEARVFVIAENEFDDLGDISTLADPSVVKSLIKGIEE